MFLEQGECRDKLKILKKQKKLGWHMITLLCQLHSPHEIISTICDFPYKIIEKCF